MHGNLPIGIAARLGQTPLFSGLDEAAIARLSRGTREIHLKKGEILYGKGETCFGLHVVLYGQIKRYFISPQGGEKVCEILGMGDSSGEVAMFAEQPYAVSAEALTETRLLHVAKTVVLDELPRNRRLTQRMLANVSSRTHQLMSEVEAFSLHSGRQRIAGYLLRTVPEDEAGDIRMTLPTAKGVIASQLNLTQEHFSRLLGELQGLGVIAINGRQIGIPNVAALRAEACCG